MTYEIGYRRPPRSGQFAKGQSGNSKGRPKGSKNFITLLEKELNQSIMVNENGKRKTITRMHAVAKKVVAGALQGDQKTVLTLFEIMRRTGQFDKSEAVSLLPDNYESILDSYVQRRQHVPDGPESNE
jgi:hypothetical protein